MHILGAPKFAEQLKGQCQLMLEDNEKRNKKILYLWDLIVFYY
jgi:hypothetical protein